MNCIYTRFDSKLTKEVTIFSIVKPFIGHIGVIQRNAIFSWTLLTPRPEIFLFGDERGTSEICQKLNLIHVPEVRRNKYDTPLLDSVFAEIHRRTSKNIIAYLNADIILTQNFSWGIQSVDDELDNFLLIGRRWNIELNKGLKFNLGWESSLNKLIREKGCLGDRDCKDYFVFPKHLFADIPSFAVGRGYWDTWMVRKALADDIPVVDGSLVITAVHQNHPYTHIRGGRNEAYMGIEAQINKTLGNVTPPGDISCANRQLKPFEYRDLPTVSVVIVTHNQAATIEKAVLSVLIQDYQDYEIIVVDDNEKTKAFLKPYANNIRFLSLNKQEKKNAYNYGLNAARGEFITFLDASSALLPGVLGKQITCFETEGSTLDILLNGCKTIENEKIIEHFPQHDFPTQEHLQPEKLNLGTKPLSKYGIMIRRSRLNSALKLQQQFSRELILEEIIYSLICIKICRVKCSKIVTEVRKQNNISHEKS